MAEWRPATVADAVAVAVLARAALGAYGEAAGLYAERIALAPAGCHVLVAGDRIVGHCISHPWRRFAPPAMHTLLGAVPSDADCWYLHDVVVAPEARGQAAVERLLPVLADVARAAGTPTLALIAVGGADRFWARLGFGACEGATAGFGADARYMELPVAGA